MPRWANTVASTQLFWCTRRSTRRDLFNKEELSKATRALPQEGLEAVAAALAGAIDGAGDQRVDYWKNRVVPYLTDVFPNIHEWISPAIRESLGQVCIVAGGAFPAALKLLHAGLQTVKHPDYLVHRLHEAGLCEEFPEPALEFLHLTVEDGQPISAERTLRVPEGHSVGPARTRIRPPVPEAAKLPSKIQERLGLARYALDRVPTQGKGIRIRDCFRLYL